MDWYYQDEGVQVGPLTEDEFDMRVKIGRISSATLVWNETMRGWQPFESIRSSGDSLAALVTCSQCQRKFPQSEVLRYQNLYVCADCKPQFFQKVKEGGALPGMLAYADFGPRLAAWLIDWIVQTLASGVLVMAIFFLTLTSTDRSGLFLVIQLISSGISLVLEFAYSVFFVTKYQATPGKMALGLIVVNADGSRITSKKAIGRFFAELLSRFTCFIGYLLAISDEEKRTLHDRLCDTRVIKK